MNQIAISKFKATCLAVLHEVQRTGKPVRITRFGKPVADVVPPALPKGKKRQLGTMAHTFEIVGDIMEPVVPIEDWELDRHNL